MTTRTACFEDDEWAEWSALDGRITTPEDKAVSPCDDCSFAFSIAMKAEGRCDGTLPRVLVPLSELQERRRAQWRAYNAKRLAKAS